jgi:hypothetical protein
MGHERHKWNRPINVQPNPPAMGKIVPREDIGGSDGRTLGQVSHESSFGEKPTGSGPAPASVHDSERPLAGVCASITIVAPAPRLISSFFRNSVGEYAFRATRVPIVFGRNVNGC